MNDRELAFDVIDEAMRLGILEDPETCGYDCELCGEAKAAFLIIPSYDTPLVVSYCCGRCKQSYHQLPRNYEKHPLDFDYIAQAKLTPTPKTCRMCQEEYCSTIDFTYESSSCNRCWSKIYRRNNKISRTQVYRNRDYRRTTRGTETMDKYHKSEKGLDARKRANDKYRDSTHGKMSLEASNKRYRATEKGKESRSRTNANYQQSEKGKEAQRLSSQRYRQKKWTRQVFAPDSKWRL